MSRENLRSRRIALERDRARAAPMGIAHQVRYLDLNEDGIPDSVLTLDRHPVDEATDRTMIEEVITIAVEIDVAGNPASEERFGRLVLTAGG